MVVVGKHVFCLLWFSGKPPLHCYYYFVLPLQRQPIIWEVGPHLTKHVKITSQWVLGHVATCRGRVAWCEESAAHLGGPIAQTVFALKLSGVDLGYIFYNWA